MYGLMPKYLWPGRHGVREKYLTAKGVRSPKSLGTAALKNGRNRTDCFRLVLVLWPNSIGDRTKWYGQNSIRTKWYGQNGIRTKCYWTKWYGQNGMDKMVGQSIETVPCTLPVTLYRPIMSDVHSFFALSLYFNGLHRYTHRLGPGRGPSPAVSLSLRL